MSIEGFKLATDGRRGEGTFNKVIATMDLLRVNGIPYGTSICYTSANYMDVTSDDFLDFLIEKGVAFSWYFHYMPVGNDAAPELFQHQNSANICIIEYVRFVCMKVVSQSF